MSIGTIRCSMFNVRCSTQQTTNDLTAEQIRALLKLESHATCGCLPRRGFQHCPKIACAKMLPAGLPATTGWQPVLPRGNPRGIRKREFNGVQVTRYLHPPGSTQTTQLYPPPPHLLLTT